MNTTIERDTGEHAVHWDQANDDLGYGRHTMKSTSYRIDPNGELTVEDILNRRTPDEILAPHPEHGGEPVSAREIVRRLALERLATPEEATAVLSARRPEPTTGVWWDRDTTPVPGVIVTDYRPDRKQHHDPDETVGFMPLTEPPLDPRFKINPEPTGPFFVPDPTKVGEFEPIDTRVPKIPLWRQALIGLKLMKDPRN